jgi:predicted patatin/cPLA2 family phospholipase
VDGVKNYRYFGPGHMFRQKSLLDIELLFDTYPNKLIPFDYETFETASSVFYTVLTDCESGQPAYIERRSVGREDFMTKVLAGSNRQGLQLNFK